MGERPTGSELRNFYHKIGVGSKVSPGLKAPIGDAVPERRYAIQSELGRGTFSRVLLGIDHDMRRNVAIKLLLDSDDPIGVQAFFEEAIITGGLEHPNIVPTYEIGLDEDLGPYYTMKRLVGAPLRDFMRTSSTEKLLGYLIEVCRAVAYAHARGVIHTDLKPDNILVGELGEVVVVDWGMALLLSPARKSQASAQLHGGTPAYMSPEQIMEPTATLDQRTDIWSIGVMLYELLTGAPPFQGDTEERLLENIVEAPLVRPSSRRPVPEPLEALCVQALEKDRSKRLQSVVALLNELLSYLDGTQERTRQIGVGTRARDQARAVLTQLEPQELALDQRAQPASTTQLDALLAGYERAHQTIERGLEATAEVAGLNQLAADLYWRVFRRLYPATHPTPAPLRERAQSMLTALSKRALPDIVSFGRANGRIARPEGDSASHEDPWLSVVLGFCDEQVKLRLNQVPSAMVELAERITLLKSVSLFEAMRACDLLPIAQVCSSVSYAQGQRVFSRGDLGTALYVLIEGEVEVEVAGRVVNTLRPGEVFGEIAVLGACPRTAGVTCSQDSRCLLLEAARFQEIIANNGEIGLALIQVLNDRLRRATQREADLLLKETLEAQRTQRKPTSS